jgi:hypothetical protein
MPADGVAAWPEVRRYAVTQTGEEHSMPERKDESPLEQGRHDTEVRRDIQMREALGMPPSGDEPKVTRDTDLFKDEPEGSER